VAGFLPPLRVSHLREVLAVALLLLGAAVAVRIRALRHARDRPDVSMLPLLALAVVALALLGAGFVVLP
jgi:putative membrane protein